MLDPQRTIGGLLGGHGLGSMMSGGWQSQTQRPQGQSMGQRFDISSMGQGGPLGFLSQLFSGFGKMGNWWGGQHGEVPGQPTQQTPSASQYSADTSNPNPMNIMGANRTGMTTFGSMLGRQPTL